MIYLVLVYLLFLVAFGVFSYFAIYHLWRFGFVGDATRTMIVVYLVAVGGIVITSFVLIFIV